MARLALSSAATAAAFLFSPIALAHAEPAGPPPPAPIIDLKDIPREWTQLKPSHMEWSDPKQFQESFQDSFDEARAKVQNDIQGAINKFMSPIAQGAYELSSGFGSRWGTTHYGADLAAPLGTKIEAAAPGTVIESGPASGFGNWIRVKLDDGTINVYGHMAASGLLVHEGDKVKAGDVIALVGSEGFSTGPHLHFEVWTPDGQKIDPQPWLKDRGIVL